MHEMAGLVVGHSRIDRPLGPFETLPDQEGRHIHDPITKRLGIWLVAEQLAVLRERRSTPGGIDHDGFGSRLEERLDVGASQLSRHVWKPVVEMKGSTTTLSFGYDNLDPIALQHPSGSAVDVGKEMRRDASGKEPDPFAA
jgi:hypothetical protein